MPVEVDVLRLLYTREGVNTVSDGEMVDQFGRWQARRLPQFWPEERPKEFLGLLENAVRTETPPVRAAACEVLKQLGKPCKACEEDSAATLEKQ